MKSPSLPFVRFRRHGLARDCRGAALTEFGLLAPVLFTLLLGSFDVGHTIYMQTVLEGALQKAARDSTLQNASGNDDSVRVAIDTVMRNQLSALNRNANISIQRRFYRTFTDVASATREDTHDGNGNGRCDNGEAFTDRNNNNVWDADGGDSVNRAGARDNVVITVVVAYPRLFPVHGFIGISPNVEVRAQTVLANQPYGDQASYDAPTVRYCA